MQATGERKVLMTGTWLDEKKHSGATVAALLAPTASRLADSIVATDFPATLSMLLRRLAPTGLLTCCR
jgi:hypothetical protein